MTPTEDASAGTEAVPVFQAELLSVMPFAARLGIGLEEATAEQASGTLEWAPALCTTGNALHGGVLMALADTVGAVCAHFNLPHGAATSTLESKTNFFRPVRSGRLRAVARRRHAGRSYIVVQTDVYDHEGRQVSLTTQTQAVIRPAPDPAHGRSGTTSQGPPRA